MKRLRDGMDIGQAFRQVFRGLGYGVVEEKGGGCWGARDPPEVISMSCLETPHATDITVVILVGSLLLDTQYMIQ